jgi:hypothetical protein
MSKKIYYQFLPVPMEYIKELKNAGKRKKARAFFEYFDDIELEEDNSTTFYAKSWEVSKSTAWEWVQEFANVTDNIQALRKLKTDRHNTFAKKSAERLPRSKRKKEASQSTENTTSQENSREAAEKQAREGIRSISIGNNSSSVLFYDAGFEDMFFGCRISNKKVGKKEEIYQEYQQHKHINHKNMRFAYLCYLSDRQAAKNDRYFGLVNFMKNQVYLNYLNARVKIELGDKVVEGVYDKEAGKLINGDEFYTLTHERFIELMKNDKITLLRTEAA